MGTTPDALPPFESPRATQPGGEGFFVRCEIAWGRLRRWYLRRFRPGHVARWRALRQGSDAELDAQVIDPRDLKFIRPGCSFWFRPEDDVYARRADLGFARWGFAELVGFSIIGLALATAFGVLAVLLHWVFLIPHFAAWLLVLEVVWFFRDPPRQPPSDPRVLVSPADGTVTHIETVSDLNFAPSVVRISIFLSIFNVHVNRVPRTGRVLGVRYFRGEFLDARHAECDRRNEQLWIDFADEATGALIRVKQISGAIARRIVCAIAPGDDVRIGDRFGMIKFGSRTEVLVPADHVGEVCVRVGEKVKGASTVLLRMK